MEKVKLTWPKAIDPNLEIGCLGAARQLRIRSAIIHVIDVKLCWQMVV